MSLRTANATAMVGLGVDIKTAMTRAGHRNAKTTLQIYTTPTESNDRQAAQLLGDWWLGGEEDGPATDMDDAGESVPPTCHNDTIITISQSRGMDAGWKRNPTIPTPRKGALTRENLVGPTERNTNRPNLPGSLISLGRRQADPPSTAPLPTV